MTFVFFMREEDNHKRLRYAAELNPFMDFIHANYHESSEIVFRSTLSDPPSSIDSLPQLKREREDRAMELEMAVSEEEAAEMSVEDKSDFVSERGISVFKTLDKCLTNVRNIVRHIAKKFSYEEAAVYLSHKRGPYIVECHLTEEIGLVERKFDKKGHKNILLYENVNIDDYIVKTYGPWVIDNLLTISKTINKEESKDECTG